MTSLNQSTKKQRILTKSMKMKQINKKLRLIRYNTRVINKTQKRLSQSSETKYQLAVKNGETIYYKRVLIQHLVEFRCLLQYFALEIFLFLFQT